MFDLTYAEILEVSFNNSDKVDLLMTRYMSDEQVPMVFIETRDGTSRVSAKAFYDTCLKMLQFARVCECCGMPLHGLPFTVASSIPELEKIEFCSFPCAQKANHEWNEKNPVKNLGKDTNTCSSCGCEYNVEGSYDPEYETCPDCWEAEKENK